MGPAVFVIAIMGCGEADAPCEPARMLAPRYASEAACVEATQDALIRNSDVDYPIVVARCVAAGSAATPLSADQVSLPLPPVRVAARDSRAAPERATPSR